MQMLNNAHRTAKCIIKSILRKLTQHASKVINKQQQHLNFIVPVAGHEMVLRGETIKFMVEKITNKRDCSIISIGFILC